MPIFYETYRTTVSPADCDRLGHMNVRHYFGAVSDGMFAFMIRLGLGPDDIVRRRISFTLVHADSEFRRELHPGDVIAVESAVLEVGDRVARFQHRLKNGTTGELAMSTIFKCALLDLETRRATLIPGDIRAAAIALMADGV
jgi:acyl-CoA thioester hydrolase